VWEGAVTFFLFPLLVALAWCAHTRPQLRIRVRVRVRARARVRIRVRVRTLT